MKNSNTSGLIKHLQKNHKDLLKDRPISTKTSPLGKANKSKNTTTESTVNGTLEYPDLRLKTEEFSISGEDKVSFYL